MLCCILFHDLCISIGQELDLFDIVSFDSEFGKTLQELRVLVERKKFLESTPGENQLEVADLRFRGAAIEDLCLDFTLPGYPDYVLKEGEGSAIVRDDVHPGFIYFCDYALYFFHVLTSAKTIRRLTFTTWKSMLLC